MVLLFLLPPLLPEKSNMMFKILQIQQFPSIFLFSQKAGCSSFRRLHGSITTLPGVQREARPLSSSKTWGSGHTCPVSTQAKSLGKSYNLAHREDLLWTAVLNWCQPGLPAEFVFPQKDINKHLGTGRGSQCKINK